ncbi:MAG: putative sulfate exporter family transporter, partial [Myxococcota bacterium]|nr:putative sulfate exporter family transporter [Myxococcota bacterium]
MAHPDPAISSQLPELTEAEAHPSDAGLRSIGGRFVSFLPGILLCVVIGFTGRSLGSLLPALGGATCAIVLGVLVGNLIRLPGRFHAGVRFCESRVLEAAVACMGFGLSLTALGSLGWRAGAVVLLAVTAALGTAWLVARFTKLSKETVMLIGVGTAICGSSAIAAAAPLMARERREVGLSVGTVSI